MDENNPLLLFQKEAPEVAGAFDNLIHSLIKQPGLDPKIKHLIYIAIKASQGDETAVKFHVPMAKKLGATRDEIKGTILLTLTTSGLKGVVSCLPSALKMYDES